MHNISFNASILDQHLAGLLETYPALFDGIRQPERRKATAFVLICLKTTLELSIEQAAKLLTDGGNDFGVDGLHVGEENDGEFCVSIFQAKYKVNDLSGTANFPENAIQKAITTVTALFDPRKAITLNDRIAPVIEEIRARVRDGAIPNVRVFLCCNGHRWNDIAQQHIDNAHFPPEQVSFHFLNHDGIVDALKTSGKANVTIQLKGKAIAEDYNYKRVLIGKASVLQLAELLDRHHDRLLEKNIRKYLGLHDNRVNADIANTLRSDDKRENFYFFNNGITIVCRQFRYNALQDEDFSVQLSDCQIINGGQTCKTIQKTLHEHPELAEHLTNTCVLLRIYELDEHDDSFVQDITYATNSQNPVELGDLHANDDIQQLLELGAANLGYVYLRKRDDDAPARANAIQAAEVAEATLAVWRLRPHQAKTMRREHFGRLYHLIFDDLNAAQAILAVAILNFAETKRTATPNAPDQPAFIPYASHYLAMRMGLLFTQRLTTPLQSIAPDDFRQLLNLWQQDRERLYHTALHDIANALEHLYGRCQNLSLQQLAATFRRGDLIDSLLYNP